MIVGLGNIGPKYDQTRHNTGFMVIDQMAKEYQVTNFKNQSEALVGDFRFNGEKILLVKPTTYMNESGRAVRPLMDYYDIPIEDVIVAYDDMDLPLGKIRLRQKGSAGGHNGIKSLIAHLGTAEFNRIKVGIEHPKQQSVVDYVLGRFMPDQRIEFDLGVDKAVKALNGWLENQSFSKLMSEFN